MLLFSTCSGNPSEAIEKYLKNAEGLPLPHYLKACEQLGAEWTSENHYGPPQPGDIRCRAIVLQDKEEVRIKQARLARYHMGLEKLRVTPERALKWCMEHAPDVEGRELLSVAAGMRRIAKLDPPMNFSGDADEWRLDRASMRGQA